MSEDTEDECICWRTTVDRAMLMLGPNDEPVGHFHMDCPLHGVKVTKVLDQDGNDITKEYLDEKAV